LDSITGISERSPAITRVSVVSTMATMVICSDLSTHDSQEALKATDGHRWGVALTSIWRFSAVTPRHDFVCDL
jgi:hypothetical protein